MKTVLVLVLVGAAIGGYLYLNPEIMQRWLKGTPLEAEPATTRVYKWKDAQGKWQITDKPPPEGVPYEAQDYRHDVNVLPLPPGLQKKD